MLTSSVLPKHVRVFSTLVVLTQHVNAGAEFLAVEYYFCIDLPHLASQVSLCSWCSLSMSVLVLSSSQQSIILALTCRISQVSSLFVVLAQHVSAVAEFLAVE